MNQNFKQAADIKCSVKMESETISKNGVSRFLKSIILIIAVLSLQNCSNSNEKHIGEWKGKNSEGEIISLILDKTNNATFVYGNEVMGGDNFAIDGIKLILKYEVDCSKSPIWLDLVIYEQEKNEEIGRFKGIVRFITDTKIEYRVNFDDDNRYENFDSEAEGTIIFEKIHEDNKRANGWLDALKNRKFSFGNRKSSMEKDIKGLDIEYRTGFTTDPLWRYRGVYLSPAVIMKLTNTSDKPISGEIIIKCVFIDNKKQEELSIEVEHFDTPLQPGLSRQFSIESMFRVYISEFSSTDISCQIYINGQLWKAVKIENERLD